MYANLEIRVERLRGATPHRRENPAEPITIFHAWGLKLDRGHAVIKLDRNDGDDKYAIPGGSIRLPLAHRRIAVVADF